MVDQITLNKNKNHELMCNTHLLHAHPATFITNVFSVIHKSKPGNYPLYNRQWGLYGPDTLGNEVLQTFLT